MHANVSRTNLRLHPQTNAMGARERHSRSRSIQRSRAARTEFCQEKRQAFAASSNRRADAVAGSRRASTR